MHGLEQHLKPSTIRGIGSSIILQYSQEHPERKICLHRILLPLFLPAEQKRQYCCSNSRLYYCNYNRAYLQQTPTYDCQTEACIKFMSANHEGKTEQQLVLLYPLHREGKNNLQCVYCSTQEPLTQPWQCTGVRCLNL